MVYPLEREVPWVERWRRLACPSVDVPHLSEPCVTLGLLDEFTYSTSRTLQALREPVPGIVNEAEREIDEGKLTLNHSTLGVILARSEGPIEVVSGLFDELP
jgi:hypothetical protein